MGLYIDTKEFVPYWDKLPLTSLIFVLLLITSVFGRIFPKVLATETQARPF